MPKRYGQLKEHSIGRPQGAPQNCTHGDSGKKECRVHSRKRRNVALLAVR
jgi:hypothetical protein